MCLVKLLNSVPPAEPGLSRGTPGEQERLEKAVRAIAAGPPPANLLDRWRFLAELGRRDLVLARLGEGHVDAVTILAEAGRSPAPGAVYGVWASRSQGTGLTATRHGDTWLLGGTLRFATGAAWIDRALVTAFTPENQQIMLDVENRGPGWRVDRGTWPAVGMDLSESYDVEVDLEAPASAEVGPPGFYVDRPGFGLGGIGVAAVWLGGARGVLDAVVANLRTPDPHQLAHLATMHVAVSAADAFLVQAASEKAASAKAASEEAPSALEARAVVDAAVRVVLDRAPRLTGPTPLCRDADFAHRLADLLVYERQHHAERDLEALGRELVGA